jgi:WD40 repeat protein
MSPSLLYNLLRQFFALFFFSPSPSPSVGGNENTFWSLKRLKAGFKWEARIIYLVPLIIVSFSIARTVGLITVGIGGLVVFACDTYFSIGITMTFLHPITKTISLAQGGVYSQAHEQAFQHLEELQYTTLAGVSLAVFSSTLLYISFLVRLGVGGIFITSPWLQPSVFGVNLDSVLNDIGMLLCSGTLKEITDAVLKRCTAGVQRIQPESSWASGMHATSQITVYDQDARMGALEARLELQDAALQSLAAKSDASLKELKVEVEALRAHNAELALLAAGPRIENMELEAGAFPWPNLGDGFDMFGEKCESGSELSVRQQKHAQAQAGQEKDQWAFAVVTGMIRASEPGGAPSFWVGRRTSHRHVEQGLLRVGNDVLSRVSTFLWWDVRLALTWVPHEGLDLEASIVLDCSFTPDGKSIFTCGESDTSLKVWDAANGLLKHTFGGHSATIVRCCCSLDGQFLLTASEDGSLKMWNAVSGLLLKTLEHGNRSVLCCDIAPNGTRILSGASRAGLKLWDASTGDVIAAIVGGGEPLDPYCVCFSPGGQLFVAGFETGTLQLFDVEPCQLQRSLAGHFTGIMDCCFSPDGHTILCGTEDAMVILYNAITGQVIRSLATCPDGVIHQCTFSPSGSMILSASYETGLVVWSVATGEVLRVLEGTNVGATGARSCSFSPCGKFAVGGYSGTSQNLQLWALPL